jgi:hypothetical protein
MKSRKSFWTEARAPGRPKPGRIPLGARWTYSFDEGLS